MRLSIKASEALKAIEYNKQLKEDAKIEAIAAQTKLDEEMEEKSFYVNFVENQRVNVRAIKETKEQVRATLLAECIDLVFENVIYDDESVLGSKQIRMNYINEFIKENGCKELLSNWKSKTYLLSEFARLTNKYTDIIMEKAEDEKGKVDIKRIDVNQDTDKMIDDIDKTEVASVAKAIGDKVADAITCFLQDKNEDKDRVTAILDKAKEKINETVNEIKIESITNRTKKEIKDMGRNRQKGIYECMFTEVAKHLAINESSEGNMFVNESGTLNMDNINEATKVAYSFLEMVVSLDMVKVDSDYIKNAIEAK